MLVDAGVAVVVDDDEAGTDDDEVDDDDDDNDDDEEEVASASEHAARFEYKTDKSSWKDATAAVAAATSAAVRLLGVVVVDLAFVD